MSKQSESSTAHPPSESADGLPGGRVSRRAKARAARKDFERGIENTIQQFEQANERLEKRAGRNIFGAVVIGLILGGGVLFSLVVIKELMMVYGAVLIGVASLELAIALRKRGLHVPRIPMVLTTLASIPVAWYWGVVYVPFVILAGLALIAIWRLMEISVLGISGSARDVFRDIGVAALAQMYITLLGSFSIALTAQPNGQWWTLAFLIVVVSTDIGAYIAGLNFGKHPMAPRISPKKTWEGFIGASVVAIAAGIILALFMLHQAWWFGIIFGAVLVVSATLGDLLESHIKRAIGIKDMSTWLAGHGGFLDRLDSILPSGVVAMVMYLIVMH